MNISDDKIKAVQAIERNLWAELRGEEEDMVKAQANGDEHGLAEATKWADAARARWAATEVVMLKLGIEVEHFPKA